MYILMARVYRLQTNICTYCRPSVNESFLLQHLVRYKYMSNKLSINDPKNCTKIFFNSIININKLQNIFKIF